MKTQVKNWRFPILQLSLEVVDNCGFTAVFRAKAPYIDLDACFLLHVGPCKEIALALSLADLLCALYVFLLNCLSLNCRILPLKRKKFNRIKHDTFLSIARLNRINMLFTSKCSCAVVYSCKLTN